MDKSKKVFLQLIKEGLKEIPQPVEEVAHLSAREMGEILILGRKHSILALLYEGLEACFEAGMEDVSSYMEQISDFERKQTLALYRIYAETDRLCKALEDKQIDAVVLKGPTVGACYRIPELRKSGDVDLWIPGLESFDDDLYKRVFDVMASLGYTWDRQTGSQHHRVFESAAGLKAEIHREFCDLFPEKERNLVIERFRKEISKESIRNIHLLDRYDFPSLSGADFLFYNLIHMAQHYYMKGFGWKFVCDWAMMMKEPLIEKEKQRLLTLIKDAKMCNFTEGVSMLALRYFGLKEEKVSFLMEGAVSENTLDLLTKQIFEAGEYGSEEEERLYAPGKYSLKEMFKVFHLQMLKNFEKASKVIILWPILWLFTLCKFIYNNKKLRHVSTLAVLQDAKRRGQEAEQMDLFER